MKCNVAQFIGSIQDGGAETLIKDYALMLDKNKFNIKIIVLRRSYGTANDTILAENNVDIIPIFKSDFLPFRVIRKLNYWWYIPYKLKYIIKQENINVLHIHLNFLKYVRRIANDLKNVRLLYTTHAPIEFFFDGTAKAEGKAAKYLIQNNHMQMIALHEDMKRDINERFGIENTVVIKNAIDFRRFQNVTESKEEIREALGIPQNAYVMGNIGRLSPQKNHFFLIDIFAELRRQNPAAFLLLIGSGELLEEIEKRIRQLNMEKCVLILSHRADIPQLLKAMDVFVFPSLYEGLPVGLIEAQVAGCRCIVSDTISEEAFQTELVIPVGLDEPPKRWVEVILDDSVKGKVRGNIKDYDMNREIKHLEKLYLGE